MFIVVFWLALEVFLSGHSFLLITKNPIRLEVIYSSMGPESIRHSSDPPIQQCVSDIGLSIKFNDKIVEQQIFL